jgi:hypothetical protein
MKELCNMIRPNKNSVLKLTALAIAAAAIVAPVAWSGSRAPVVDRTSASSRATAQEDQHDRFIVTYRDSSRASKAAVQTRFADASTTLGMGIQGLRTLSTGSDDGRVDERPERTGGRGRHPVDAEVRAQ